MQMSSEDATFLEHQMRSASYDLVSLFQGRRSTVDKWNGKKRKNIGRRPSTVHSTFHFRKDVSQSSTL